MIKLVIQFKQSAYDGTFDLRYARNLAEGQGLVWNPGGPRVEGFTNPLWVGYMAIFHVLGVDETLTSLCIQISGAVFMLLTLLVGWRLASAGSAAES